MVLRYANALAVAGWEVAVVMAPGGGRVGLPRRAMRSLRYVLGRWSRGYSPQTWMAVDPRVRLLWVRDLEPERAPSADVVVATAVQTAEAVARWPAAAGRKVYFVQGYETCELPAERVHASWHLPLRKFAVSRWLCDLIAAAGSCADHLPNGLDPVAFGVDRPMRERAPLQILWPHHRLRFKGSADVLEAVRRLDDAHAPVELHAFGTGSAPRGAGRPVYYHRNPPQAELRALYNSAAVLVAPSHSEGWGLPACEALQCGCAVVASDIGGHREFLVHGHNALLYPAGDSLALRTAVCTLLHDAALRERLAQAGLADMARLQFGPSAERLRGILEDDSRDA